MSFCCRTNHPQIQRLRTKSCLFWLLCLGFSWSKLGSLMRLWQLGALGQIGLGWDTLAGLAQLHMFLVLLGSSGQLGHTLLMVITEAQQNKQKHVIPLEAQAQNWHTITPASFCWLEQATWPKSDMRNYSSPTRAEYERCHGHGAGYREGRKTGAMFANGPQARKVSQVLNIL